MTPPALFTEMVRTAETLLHRQAAETVCCTESMRAHRSFTTSSPVNPKQACSRMIRRQEWLAATAPPEEGGDPEAAPASPRAGTADKYGVDLEEFKMKSSRKPRDFKKCLRIAEWTVDGSL